MPIMRRVTVAGLLFPLLVAIGCSGISTRSIVPFGGSQNAAFLGVRFGEALDAVQQRHPGGTQETSPYGSPAYRIGNINAGAIEYQSVIYEFTDRDGMQLVYATFAPSWSGDVYRQLEQTLGTPIKTNGASDPSKVEASWNGKTGEFLTYLGPEHCLAIVGPKGETLRADVALRSQS